MSAKDNKLNDKKCIIDVITIDDEDDDLSDVIIISFVLNFI
jgi:hypothetical protein